MRTMLRLIALIPLCLPVLLAAEEMPDRPPLLAEIREAAVAHDSLRTTFTMERHLAVFEEPVISTGSLEIDRELGGVRWEFTDELLLILHDDQLRRWDDEGNEEVVDTKRDPGAAVLARQMRALLDGDWSGVHEDFRQEWTPKRPRELIMVPADEAMRKLIGRIEVTFGTESGLPDQLIIRTPGGDHTIYRFAGAELDVVIAAERFAGPSR